MPSVTRSADIVGAQIDLGAIQERLFADPNVRARILRDYDLKIATANAAEMVSALLAKMAQEPAPVPLDRNLTNADVFRAAVRAIGSNSRSWATFLKNEPSLSDRLCGYDPSASRNATRPGEP